MKMTKVLLLLLCTMITIGCNTTRKEGANSDLTKNNRTQISGNVQNSRQEYISLNYTPRLRGNLNYDDFENFDTHIDSNGHFKLHPHNITDAATYTLEFESGGLALVLFDGDEIKLDFDMDNPKTSLFVTGRGAGKINALNLAQFGFYDSKIATKYGLDEFDDYIMNAISVQRKLLDAIYNKNVDHEIIVNAKNKDEILRIIKTTPLSEKEYKLLLNLVDFRKHSLLTDFLSIMGNRKKMDSVEIDFDNSAFGHLDKRKFKNLDNINYWYLASNVQSILQLEYLRDLKSRKDVKITYGNWNTFLQEPEFIDWVPKYLKPNFNEDIYNKYFADYAAWFMTLGYDYNLFYKNIDSLSQNNKYAVRLKAYKELLDSGLDNKEYGLNSDTLVLNEKKFDLLLKRYDDKPLMITFWSAEYAGSTIIDNLQAIKSFEKENRINVRSINICIDKEVNKNLWAARIIDNSWKSEHYFMPEEGNEFALKKCTDKGIAAFCNGGATYSYMDKNGKLHNEIEFPFHKSIEGIENMANQNLLTSNVGI